MFTDGDYTIRRPNRIGQYSIDYLKFSNVHTLLIYALLYLFFCLVDREKVPQIVLNLWSHCIRADMIVVFFFMEIDLVFDTEFMIKGSA